MNKFFIFGSIVIILIFSIIFLKPFKSKEKVLSIQNQAVVPTQIIKTSLPSSAEKIEVFVFHTTQRCLSCINIGKYTKSVIEEKFSEDLKSGKIIFREINIDLSENRQLAKDYQVNGSSLFITVTKDGQIFKEEDNDVWRYVSYETKFKSYFESKLKSLL